MGLCHRNWTLLLRCRLPTTLRTLGVLLLAGRLVIFTDQAQLLLRYFTQDENLLVTVACDDLVNGCALWQLDNDM